MPMHLVNMHAEEMPKLMAREALHHSTVAAAGAGGMGKAELRSTLRAWRRQAELERPRKAASRAELLAVLGSVGVKVSEAKRG